MAYTTLDDVRSLIAQFTVDASSKPAATQVQAMTEDISTEIDSVIAAAGYAVPVTAPSWWINWLALLNAYGAAATALKSMFPGASGVGENPAYAFWEQRYKDGLVRLADGSAIPPAVARSVAAVGASTYLTRNPDADEYIGDLAEPHFKVGKQY